jgi:hypothetical protein
VPGPARRRDRGEEREGHLPSDGVGEPGPPEGAWQAQGNPMRATALACRARQASLTSSRRPRRVLISSGRALQVMLVVENPLRALLICHGVRTAMASEHDVSITTGYFPPGPEQTSAPAPVPGVLSSPGGRAHLAPACIADGSSRLGGYA